MTRNWALLLAGLILLAGLWLARPHWLADGTPPTPPQVLLVMATRDIASGSVLTSDDLTSQPFPAGFVPEGAVPAPDQAIGKYAVTQITKGQVILVTHLSVGKPPPMYPPLQPIPTLPPVEARGGP
jgi:Flp pilus assembly protein CpaB